ncbi:hypothetical protein BGZ72_002741 [Mortierella alpina]|nr:hypothetical protein BGZ72_002741 [Mortierella alpina]
MTHDGLLSPSASLDSELAQEATSTFRESATEQRAHTETSARSRAGAGAGTGAGSGSGSGSGSGPGPETRSEKLEDDEDETAPEAGAAPWPKGFTARFQDHLKLFFSIHHKLFDLVAFYVVMFALNGQMTSLPTRLEWIGFCVQSIVALRRAFQTSIKHGIGLTSFLGMLDLLVGQLFLHQDRLGLLPTVANILVYFYVINLTRGLVFGDSVSCLLWFLFGLVDIYRKDPSSASILDLTPYKVIPVHTVGFGLYILMSELVDVMLHSAEPDPVPGRYLNYNGTQKEGPVSMRSSSRRSVSSSSDPSNSLRFELCITEITPFTVSFCLNALSEQPVAEPGQGQDVGSKDSIATSTPLNPSTGLAPSNETVDLAAIKIGSAASIFSSASSSRQSKSVTTPRIISTSDIVIHVNFIPWHQVQYHFPDDQSFTLYGLTPSTDYEIEMKVHQFSSFVARVGTRAAPPGTPIPTKEFEKVAKSPDLASIASGASKSSKNRKSRKIQKAQKEADSSKGKGALAIAGATAPTSASAPAALAATSTKASDPTAGIASSPSSPTPPLAEVTHGRALSHGEDTVSKPEAKSLNESLLEQLQGSLQAVSESTAAVKALVKKLKRDQGKAESLLRQELEGIGRGQAKAMIQDQKRRQKLSFLQESIKQTDASSLALQNEIQELKATGVLIQPKIELALEASRAVEQRIQASQSSGKAEILPLKQECQHLKAEIKRLEAERAEWTAKATQLREGEIAPLQLRLQRLEQQQIVWKVAAEASKDKDREASLKAAVYEEEAQRLTVRAQELEDHIQDVRSKSVAIEESLEKEMEVWQSLEQESDQTNLSLSFQPASQQQPLSVHGSHRNGGSIETGYGDSHYWFSGGAGAGLGLGGSGSGEGSGTGSDLWRNASASFTASGLGDSRVHGHSSTRELASDMGMLTGGGLWDVPALGSLLDGSKPNRVTGASRALGHE